MLKIVDIKILKGRCAEDIECAANLMKLAKNRYTKFIKKYDWGEEVSIEKWACDGHEFSDKGAYKHLFNHTGNSDLLEAMKESGFKLLKKELEISLEQKIINHIKDGWHTKGDILLSSGGHYIQTMVKYETSKMIGLP